MMLPVSVMKVMPTATQPMNEIALSSALMLSGEVKPGVVSAKTAMRRDGDDRGSPMTMRRRRSCRAAGWVMSASTRCRSRFAAAIRGDLPAAVHADDDVGHAEHLLDVRRRHDEAIAAVAEFAGSAGRFPPARRRRRRGSARSSAGRPVRRRRSSGRTRASAGCRHSIHRPASAAAPGRRRRRRRASTRRRAARRRARMPNRL